jgi:hypothetical protein
MICMSGSYIILVFFPRSAGLPELRDWTEMAESYDNLKNSVSIAHSMIVNWLFCWCRISLNEHQSYAG